MAELRLSKFFTLTECLFLPSWGRVANEADGLTDEILANLKILCRKMDKVRLLVEVPIVVHCAYRPPEYNKQVGGAPNSWHMKGMAMDFHASYWDCDYVRSKLRPHLEELEMRMENLPGSSWIHMDIGTGTRYFKP